jgi:quercetin dioxygenase-like cupin family protein
MAEGWMQSKGFEGVGESSRAAATARVFGLMVVRDAADLLELNFRHHTREGVERFLVLDHQSLDETPSILERWEAAGIVEWDRVVGPFCVERWVNDLALAAYMQGADWVLPIDADELWTAGEGRLVDVLTVTTADVLEAEVLNFVQERDQIRSEPGSLLRMVHRVERLTPLEEGQKQFLDGSLPLVAIECPRKCISRVDPALWIRRGNHRVERPGRRERRSEILCLHAPLRSRAALEQRRRVEGLADPALATGDSWHWRRWSTIAGEAELGAEWQANSVAGGRLGSSDIPVVIDRRVSDLARRAMASNGPCEPDGSVQGLPTATSVWSESSRCDLTRLRRAFDLRPARSVVEALRRENELLREELAAARSQRAELEAGVTARLAVLAAIESSRAHRSWMASIRARRALRRLLTSFVAARPRTERRLCREFRKRGFLDPLPIFDAAECCRIATALRADTPLGSDWGKDTAATSRLMYEVAANETLGSTLEALLGEDVMLWGASIIVRQPGDVHPWHTDIESSSPEGGTVSVWLGLENVSRESSLLVVEGSHRFGEPLQKVAQQHARRRGEATDREVEQWARARDPHSRIVQFEAREGEALLFDGRLWHGSRNTSNKTRTALLLQYATLRTPIRILDPTALEWPFRFLDEPRPRCIPIRARATIDPAPVNRFVAPPPEAPRDLSPLGAAAEQLALPLAPDRRKGWRPYSIFSGSTPNLRSLSCHVSVLSPGCCPHPPHQHPEEELLVMLDGAAELVVGEAEGGETVYPASPGTFSYYPAHELHTLRSASDSTATYLMLRWIGRGGGKPAVLHAAAWQFDQQRAEVEAVVAERGGFAARTVFEGATRDLALLHCHYSAVAPGGGYEPHVDEHDVALVLMSGTIETIGARVTDHGVIFIPAGIEHGLHNPGSTTASYLVFELHRDAREAVLARKGVR